MTAQSEQTNGTPRSNTTSGTVHARPEKECDLVMKGGITSGVVYPAAVLELKDQYRFRAIGGTSVGAMAAAATAAAEYARDTGGFERLAAIQANFRKKDYLKSLFVPVPGTGPLMRAMYTIVPGVSKGRHWALVMLTVGRALLSSHYVGAALGAVAGALLCVGFVAVMGGALTGWRLAAPALAAFGGGLLGGAIGLALILLFVLKNTMFGICIGHDKRSDLAGPANRPTPPLPLTDWLHRSLQNIAGRETGGGGPVRAEGATPASGNDGEREKRKPLTFGDLEQKLTPHGDGTPRGIILRMFTTNLSEGQPYELPFRQQRFLFSREDMERVFPADVVKHLIDHAMKPPQGVSLRNLKGFHYLPEACDLPVVFGVRLSLSFPVLISAVRLYTLEAEALESASGEVAPTYKNLLHNWFSDGGICSNFPIHLFDRWLPPYPTFGMDLTSFPNGQGSSVPKALREGVKAIRRRGKPSPPAPPSSAGKRPVSAGPRPSQRPVPADADVGGFVRPPEPGGPGEFAPYLPRADDPFDSTDYNKISSVPGLLGAILSTARNHRDNMQGMLPSYRERIVQIPFRPGQGGLNLTMSDDAIKQIEDDGRRAAGLLREQFDFDHHRWVRFRVMGRELEDALINLTTEVDLGSIKTMLDNLAGAPDSYPFPLDAEWCSNATTVVDELSRLIGALKGLGAASALPEAAGESTRFFPPLPIPADMALRVVPEA
jgi:hypothetical protein